MVRLTGARASESVMKMQSIINVDYSHHKKTIKPIQTLSMMLGLEAFSDYTEK